MNRAPSEDLHNSLLASQDLSYFEEIHKKASHDRLRGCYDDFEGYQTYTVVTEDYQSAFEFGPFPQPTGHRFCLANFEPFQKLGKFGIARFEIFIRFILT